MMMTSDCTRSLVCISLLLIDTPAQPHLLAPQVFTHFVLCSLLLRARTVKSLITKMLNQQPRMRVNALFNYLVEMHSVPPSLKQQVRNFVHNHRNRYMSLALGYAP